MKTTAERKQQAIETLRGFFPIGANVFVSVRGSHLTQPAGHRKFTVSVYAITEGVIAPYFTNLTHYVAIATGTRKTKKYHAVIVNTVQELTDSLARILHRKHGVTAFHVVVID